MMCTLKETTCSLTNISNSRIVTAVETALQQTLTNIQELVMDYEQLTLNYKGYESQYLEQKEKCESQTCRSSLELKKANEAKDNIIQSIASAVTKLCETRDFNTINEISRIICGESSPKSDQCVNINKHEEQLSPTYIKHITKDDVKENKAIHDESVSEIEGTPTGRRSPIIFSRKSRSNINVSGPRDKKKCPENWPSPETKTIKLSFPTPTRTPNGRLKQTRLNIVKVKPKCLIDLTSSPEVKTEKTFINPVPVNVKKEELDDETILPSPSGLSNFYTLHKSLKGSPSKFKKPNLSLKLKVENTSTEKLADENMIENTKSEPRRFQTPVKLDMASSETADESMSLLPQIGRLPGKATEGNCKTTTSPIKGPLVENYNVVNIQNQLECNSESILRNPNVTEDNVKRRNLEPVYKEPTVRKRSEKRALPGWSCDECKNFYDELYADNPEMLERKMEECSKHRGRHNPARPATPPGFWEPRWDVPTDTEEFNRRNNAL